MGFTKREVAENFVSIGDGEGDVKKAGGILIGFVQNTHFATPKTDYQYINQRGEIATLSGSASLSRQIHAEDVGKFFKAEFEGWGKSNKGQFKKIAVYIWDGEPDETMRNWPRFAEYYNKRTAAEAPKQNFEEKPAALEDDDDDDLPF